MSALGDLYLKISGDMKPLKDALGKGKAELNKFAKEAESSVNKVSKGFMNLKTAIGAALIAGAAVKGFNLMMDALDRADAIGDTAERIGMTAEKLQELQFAAGQNGSSAEEMSAALEKLNLNIGLAQSGTGKLADVMERYGISLKNADGTMKTTEQTFNEIIALIGRTKNENEKAAIAAAAFGKEAGPKLVALMSDGGKAIEAAAEKARKYGIVLSNDMVKGAGKAKDDLEALKLVFSVQLTRAILDNVDTITEWAEKVRVAFVKLMEHSEMIIKVMKILGVGIAAVFAAKTVALIFNVGMAILQVTKHVTALTVAMRAAMVAAGPVGWIALGASLITAGVGAAKLTEEFKKMKKEAEAAMKAASMGTDYNESLKATQANFETMRNTWRGAITDADQLKTKLAEIDAMEQKAIATLKQRFGVDQGSTDNGLGYDPNADANAKAEEDRKKQYLENQKEIDAATRRSKELKLEASLREKEEQEKIFEEYVKRDEALNEEAETIRRLVDPWREVGAEIQRINELTALGKLTEDERAERLKQIMDEQNEKLKETGGIMEGLKAAQGQWIDGFSDELTAALMDGKANFADFAKSVMRNIMKLILQAMILKAILGIGGAMAGSSNATVAKIGGGILDVFGPPKKASGGAISGPTVVGERGKELFVPSAPGRILNNHQTNRVMGATPNFKVEVVNRGSTPTKATQSNARFDGKQWVVGIILEDLARGGPISNGMGQNYGLRRAVK